MKKWIILSTSIFLGYLSVAQVQRNTTALNRNDTAINNNNSSDLSKVDRRKMIKELNLSREQKLKVKHIHEDNQIKKTAIENNDKLSAAEKKKQIHFLQKEQLENILKILNEEQKERLRAKRAAMQKNGMLPVEEEWK